MARAGREAGSDQVGRLMRARSLAGARRVRRTFSTRKDPVLTAPQDLVQRRFQAAAPWKRWFIDITYVATWVGLADVLFVIDAFSWRIVGWSLSKSLKAESSQLPALEMAACAAGGDLTGLVHRSDHGSN